MWTSIKRWVKKLGDDQFQVKFHKWATIFWFVAAFPICIFLANSVPFIVFISVYAVVTGHWSSMEASLAKIESKKTNED